VKTGVFNPLGQARIDPRTPPVPTSPPLGHRHCPWPNFPAMNEALLHVGNLPYSIERDDLEAIFLNAGTVVSASLMTYKFDSRSSGYGFVEMASPEEARKAVEMYNGREVRERNLAVNLARPRTASFVKRAGG